MSDLTWPGPGRYPLALASPGFYLLLALLATFGLMLFLLHRQHPGRRRGIEGYFEAASIDLAFLLVGLGLVLALAFRDPHGNRTASALFSVVIGGYWYTFAIPVVTVGASIHKRTRGGVPWLVPSLVVAVGLFFALFAYYFEAGGVV